MSHRSIHPRRMLSALKPGKFVAGVAAGAIVLGGAGIAFGAIPGSGGVINACVTNVGGIVRVIDPATHASCTRAEKPLTWNQTGPQGQQGLQGPEGPQGPPGPAAPVAPTPAPPATQVVARFHAALVLGPADVDVYGYDLGYRPDNTTSAPNMVRLFLRGDPDGLRLRHSTTTPMDASMDLLLPDGRVALSLALSGAQVGRFQDQSGDAQVDVTFTSIRITDQWLDFSPSDAPLIGALSVGANQQLQLRSLGIGVAAGTNDVAVRASTTFSADLDRVGALELHVLLNNPPTTINALDYVRGTTTTNETMVAEGVHTTLIHLTASGAVDDPTPLLTVGAWFTRLTTTTGSTTTCFAYDTNTAC